MSDGDEFHIGHFGHKGRQRAGATVFRGVMESGSLVPRQVGGTRSGEKSIHNFLSRPEVTPQEIIATADVEPGRRIAVALPCTKPMNIVAAGPEQRQSAGTLQSPLVTVPSIPPARV